MSEIQQLYTERYRWKSLDNMILPVRVKSALSKGLVTNTFLYGPPGNGKTTIARILTDGMEVLRLNGSSENGIDIIRNKVVNFASTLSILNTDSKMKVVFIDEADGLTDAAWDAMRETIEHYASSVRFICTCNKFDKIPSYIQSRFTCVPVYPINKEEEDFCFNGYCALAGAILRKDGISFDDETLKALVKASFPDMRTMLTTLQTLHLQGATELDKDSIIKTFDCSDLLNLIVEGSDPVENYKMIVGNYSTMVDDAMLAISKTFVDFIMANYPQYNGKIPYIIIVIAEYMAQLPNAIDKTVVLLACCYKLQMLLKG